MLRSAPSYSIFPTPTANWPRYGWFLGWGLGSYGGGHMGVGSGGSYGGGQCLGVSQQQKPRRQRGLPAGGLPAAETQRQVHIIKGPLRRSSRNVENYSCRGRERGWLACGTTCERTGRWERTGQVMGSRATRTHVKVMALRHGHGSSASIVMTSAVQPAASNSINILHSHNHEWAPWMLAPVRQYPLATHAFPMCTHTQLMCTHATEQPFHTEDGRLHSTHKEPVDEAASCTGVRLQVPSVRANSYPPCCVSAPPPT